MTNIIHIQIPDIPDSFSRVVLDGEAYLIRFTYNATADRWRFGLYTMQKEPIAVGLPIVPSFPLNMQVVDERFPRGLFGAYSKLEYIGRNDFLEGKAAFSYIPRVDK